MGIYGKGDYVVEAHQLQADCVYILRMWCKGIIIEEIDAEDSKKRYVGINIPTLEGVIRASENDYIIKGVSGEFEVCKPGAFAVLYDPM